MNYKIYLSPPHLSGDEGKFIQEALESGWITSLGPQVDAFEKEVAEYVGIRYALALSSGTAAIHLALILAGVREGDEVLVSTLTFAGSVYPVLYLHAKPIFVDSERESWNLDPNLLEDFLKKRAKIGKLPKVLMVVHIYGQCANLEPIMYLCDKFGVTLIEDAAEALGATYHGKFAGTFGKAGIFSFNGNKIITTSGGGMLVSNDRDFVEHAQKLATQARDPAPHYEHSEIGYNYRISNILAAIGRAQLRVIEDRIKRKREIFDYYQCALKDLPGIEFMPEASWGRCTRWLTVITVDPKKFGADREEIRLALTKEGIESRPVWKPMHLQPVFKVYEYIGEKVAEEFFEKGLCLPCGTSMTQEDLQKVVDIIISLCRA